MCVCSYSPYGGRVSFFCRGSSTHPTPPTTHPYYPALLAHHCNPYLESRFLRATHCETVVDAALESLPEAAVEVGCLGHDIDRVRAVASEAVRQDVTSVVVVAAVVPTQRTRVALCARIWFISFGLEIPRSNNA